jgi:hypothetical protein
MRCGCVCCCHHLELLSLRIERTPRLFKGVKTQEPSWRQEGAGREEGSRGELAWMHFQTATQLHSHTVTQTHLGFVVLLSFVDLEAVRAPQRVHLLALGRLYFLRVVGLCVIWYGKVSKVERGRGRGQVADRSLCLCTRIVYTQPQLVSAHEYNYPNKGTRTHTHLHFKLVGDYKITHLLHGLHLLSLFFCRLGSCAQIVLLVLLGIKLALQLTRNRCDRFQLGVKQVTTHVN